MSLQVDPSGHRGRSRSSSNRDRDRDRDRDRSQVRHQPEPGPIRMESVEMPSPPAGYGYDYDDHDYNDAKPRGPPYDVNNYRDSYRLASPTQESSYYRPVDNGGGHDSYAPRREKDESPIDRLKSTAEALLPPKYAQKLREVSAEREQKKEIKKEKLETDLAYGSTTALTNPKASAAEPVPPPGLYAKPPQWEYDQPVEKVVYAKPKFHADLFESSDPRSPGLPRTPRLPGSLSANVMTADPAERSSRRGRSPQPPPVHSRVSSLAVNASSAGGHSASSSLSVQTGHTNTARHSASSSLAVNASSVGGHSPSHSLSSAPPSPLQEAYHGTYQSISPMPSPLLLASHHNSPHNSTDLLEPLSPGLSDSGEFGEKTRRRARFHDPVDDAARLAQALRGDRHPPDTAPLIEILPGMTHEQLMDLRAEYKRLVKAGPEHKGVNVAKHIRARLKDEEEPRSLMKACYATALGRWESEAYWANFWYQGDKTRRELLIESLMGRPNDEIARIKDAFNDKKYGDSLTRCMKTELREDKFKKAVLLALEERRMEERDEEGRPLPVDFELVRDDVEALYRAVRAEKGGESAMIQIVVLRSDTHLREILRLYEKSFRSNFARDMLKKSGNLVGEVLAHILNGVINKPVRDALLLNHALRESSSSSSHGSRKDQRGESLRRELLTSRLVRYHWDRHHMAAVKRAYRDRYGQELADAVREGTSGQWGLFCQQLVVTRMPDDVKKFESVEIIREVRKEDRDRERERERDRERERERDGHRDSDREQRHHRHGSSSSYGERDGERERERERERGEKRHSTSTRLEVRGHSTRDRSRSRERSRSRRRE